MVKYILLGPIVKIQCNNRKFQPLISYYKKFSYRRETAQAHCHLIEILSALQNYTKNHI